MSIPHMLLDAEWESVRPSLFAQVQESGQEMLVWLPGGNHPSRSTLACWMTKDGSYYVVLRDENELPRQLWKII